MKWAKEVWLGINKKCFSAPMSAQQVVKRWREIGVHDRPSKLGTGRYSALVRGLTNITLWPVYTRGHLFSTFRVSIRDFLQLENFFYHLK